MTYGLTELYYHSYGRALPGPLQVPHLSPSGCQCRLLVTELLPLLGIALLAGNSLIQGYTLIQGATPDKRC